MSQDPNKDYPVSVGDVCDAMETIAPTALAQSWDNVGLLAGDRAASARRILLTIDLTPAVADEAVERKIDLVLAYHPPIFKPIARLCADGAGPESAVLRCLQSGASVYATHTALDAADGGTNDVIAALCGVSSTEPLEYVDKPGAASHKLVVFVPTKNLEDVAEALAQAGAGRIGDYTHCSYRTSGMGTFLGGEGTNPVAGERGRLELVEEVRLETIIAAGALPGVVDALRRAHPYEEVAFDVYPLKPEPVRGIGRRGAMAQSMPLGELAQQLQSATDAACVQLVGPSDRRIDRAIVVVGAAGSLPFRLPLTPHDVIVTGEIRHHDALTIDRRGCCAIALGHWASERPILKPLAVRLRAALPDAEVAVSERDRDPFDLATS